MIPLKDKTLRRRFPFVNIALLLANIALFLFVWSMPSQQVEAFISQYGFVPARFFGEGGFGPGRFLPLFTSIFMHGGWLHLGGNMLSLWIFGDNVEDRMGHIPYLLFYLVTGIIASLVHGFIYSGSSVPVVGASGAIAGVLGAYLLLFPRAKVVTIIPIFFFFFISTISAVFFIGFWFILQLFQGVLALNPDAGTGVAFWAHIGGFVVGLALALVIARRGAPYLPDDRVQFEGREAPPKAGQR